MNRCLSDLFSHLLSHHLRWRVVGVTALVFSTVWASAHSAPVRPFPPKALIGQMQVVQAPNILIDGKAERLSPGARIRGANNMLTMSAPLTGQTHTVKYLRESNGMVHEVWILTPAEIQAALTKP
jgi:hypothetical protein